VVQFLTNISWLEIFPSLLANLRLDFPPSFPLRRSVKDETRHAGNEVDPNELLLELQSNLKEYKERKIKICLTQLTLNSLHNASAIMLFNFIIFSETFVSKTVNV